MRRKPLTLLSGGNPQIAKADADAPVQAYIAAIPGWKRDVSRRILALVLLSFVAACSASRPPVPVATAPETLHVRVLSTHDIHGTLRPTTFAWSQGRPIGGVSALKTMMDTFEAACACPTFRLDGGDQMQGTLESNTSAGASTVAALNLLGVDAAAVGNHELDWGVETLVTRQREARYAWLAANVFRVDNGQRPEWTRPFTIVERRGARIGVVGYATVSTPETLRTVVTRPYQFRSGYAAIRDALDAVWQARPDFVVIVAHAGGECGTSGCSGEMVELASELPRGRVHLIIGGHDHSPGEGVVNEIPIIRAGSNTRAIGVIDLYRRPNGVRTFTMTQETVYADAVAADRGMVDLLAPYLAAVDAKAKEPVTTLAERLSASATGDRRLGGFLADAVRRAASADVGLQNPGGVRADLPAGAVLYGDVHRVMPFDNAVVRLTITGRQLRQLAGQTSPRFYYSNLAVERDAAGAVVSMRFADGSPVRDEQAYSLGTSDFLADGGDGLTMLSALPREVIGITLLEAVIGRLRELPAPVVLPLRTP